jgi:hypothetical protein
MGKGKGSFDHWAARVAVNQVLFEVKGMLHEQVVRDAFRLAGNKLPGMLHSYRLQLPSVFPRPLLLTSTFLPGQHEFVMRGDPPVVGITKLDGITLEELKRPRRQLPGAEVPPAVSAAVSATPSSITPAPTSPAL